MTLAIQWGAAPDGAGGWEGWVDVPFPDLGVALQSRGRGRTRGSALARAAIDAPVILEDAEDMMTDAPEVLGFLPALAAILPGILSAVSNVATSIVENVADDDAPAERELTPRQRRRLAKRRRKEGRKAARRIAASMPDEIRGLASQLAADLDPREACAVLGFNPYAEPFGLDPYASNPYASPYGYGYGGAMTPDPYGPSGGYGYGYAAAPAYYPEPYGGGGYGFGYPDPYGSGPGGYADPYGYGAMTPDPYGYGGGYGDPYADPYGYGYPDPATTFSDVQVQRPAGVAPGGGGGRPNPMRSPGGAAAPRGVTRVTPGAPRRGVMPVPARPRR